MLKPESSSGSRDEEALVNKFRESFQQRVDAIDDETMAELDCIRQRAVEAAGTNARLRVVRSAYAVALAASVLVVAVLFNSVTSPESLIHPDSDFEMVVVNNDFELLEEDPEFYQWLEVELENGDV